METSASPSQGGGQATGASRVSDAAKHPTKAPDGSQSRVAYPTI
jgi:hypothetical protein